jgi:dCMP deaminase
VDIKWSHRFLELAQHVANWSKDPSTKVGAVIVNPQTKQVISFGYNGFPRGVEDSKERLENKEVKYKYVVHAEVNAIINANISVRGMYLYVYPTIMIPAVCPECAKVVAQAGIKKVFFYQENNLSSRWEEMSQYTKNIFMESGIEWEIIPKFEDK